MDVMGFISKHPLWIAGGVFIVGLMFVLSRGGGGSGDGGMSAFYAAQAASKTSGNQVMLAQIAANAQTSIATSYFATQKDTNALWANTQLEQTKLKSAAAVQMAPYQAQAAYLQTVAQIANAPVQTQTTTKSSGGFFGIGAKSKTSTTVIPNPAWNYLASFEDFFSQIPGAPALPGG
jgi:hypothetical protein